MSALPTQDAATEGLDLRSAGRRVLLFAGGLLLIAVALRTLPGLSDVRDRFGSASPVWLAIAFACELGSVF